MLLILICFLEAVGNFNSNISSDNHVIWLLNSVILKNEGEFMFHIKFVHLSYVVLAILQEKVYFYNNCDFHADD